MSLRFVWRRLCDHIAFGAACLTVIVCLPLALLVVVLGARGPADVWPPDEWR